MMHSIYSPIALLGFIVVLFLANQTIALTTIDIVLVFEVEIDGITK
jgi:hypothetical protein